MTKSISNNGIFRDALQFYKYNPVLTALCYILTFVEALIIYRNGIVGLWHFASVLTLLAGIFCFFRIPLYYREMFDFSDCFWCIYHILTGSLQYYFEETTVPYHIEKKRKIIICIQRMLLTALFIYLTVCLSDVEPDRQKPDVYPFTAISVVVLSTIAGVVISALIHRKCSRLYSVGYFENEEEDEA